MEKYYFIELLNRYARGESTKEEERLLISYYNLFEHEAGIMDLLSAESKEELKREINKNIWNSIASREQTGDKSVTIRKWVINVSAAAILIGILVTGGFYFRKEFSSKKVVTGFNGQVKRNSIIVLADGSKVILNSGSKLDYPESFEGLSKREVYLEGEAFFDVMNNPAKPFIVRTGKLETTVLGTAFNISAFPGDLNITVTVKRGKVKVSDHHKVLAIITPHEQITFNKQKASATKEIVNNENYLNWKGKELSFNDLTVKEAAALLEEQFNVHIIIKDEEVGLKRFTANFSRNEDLEQVLKSICEFNGAKYEYDAQRSVVVMKSE